MPGFLFCSKEETCVDFLLKLNCVLIIFDISLRERRRVLASMICIILVIKIFFNSINHLELITPDKKVKCLFMD